MHLGLTPPPALTSVGFLQKQGKKFSQIQNGHLKYQESGNAEESTPQTVVETC
jgi:hypothetical protein